MTGRSTFGVAPDVHARRRTKGMLLVCLHPEPVSIHGIYVWSSEVVFALGEV